MSPRWGFKRKICDDYKYPAPTELHQRGRPKQNGRAPRPSPLLRRREITGAVHGCAPGHAACLFPDGPSVGSEDPLSVLWACRSRFEPGRKGRSASSMGSPLPVAILRRGVAWPMKAVESTGNGLFVWIRPGSRDEAPSRKFPAGRAPRSPPHSWPVSCLEQNTKTVVAMKQLTHGCRGRSSGATKD